ALTFGGNGNDWTGYSFYATSITTSGSGNFYCPTHKDNSGVCVITGIEPLFDAYGATRALSLQGSGNTASGNMFAANGSIDVQGGGVGAGTGFLEAQTLAFHGNFSNFTGVGPGNGGVAITPITTVSTVSPGTTVNSTS